MTLVIEFLFAATTNIESSVLIMSFLSHMHALHMHTYVIAGHKFSLQP